MLGQEQLASIVSEVLASLINLSSDEIDRLFERPKDAALGDLSLPCFQFARTLKKAPPIIAKEAAALVSAAPQAQPYLASIEAVGPYVNFRFRLDWLGSALDEKITSGSFLLAPEGSPERVMIEYSQPNTHKAFHVGHIRNAAYGDSLVRMLEWMGHEVIAANYIGDEGTHVAKCLWYLTEHYRGEIPADNRGEFLGALYFKATELLDLSLLTEAPYPGVVVGEVITVDTHPKDSAWRVVEVKLPHENFQVVCGDSSVSVGLRVAFAPVGVRTNGRAVQEVDRKGVRSAGMICTRDEIGLTGEKQSLVLFPDDIPLGTEVVEVFRRADISLEREGVLETLRAREAQVGDVLSALERGEPKVKALWEKTKAWSMEEFHVVYEWLNCRFDHWFFESEYGDSSKALVRKYLAQGVFIEDDGAIGANLEQYGLGFCLLIKSNGTALYATRDLALAQRKFDEFGIQRSLYVVDAAQRLHFQQVFQCLKLMGYPQADQCVHLEYAQVVRPDGKMSSRKGNVILFSELRERLLSKITDEYLEKYRGDWSDEEISETAYRIALATMRYGMMNQDSDSQIIFDLDEWTSRSGNTGPYMLYANARIRSILRESAAVEAGSPDWSSVTSDEERELLVQLSVYPETVLRAAETYAPARICSYLFDLSKSLNRMYANCPVLKAETDGLRLARLKMLQATSTVLTHGLELLGVKVVERM